MSVGNIPLGGLRLGYPSVSSIVNIFLFLSYSFFNISSAILNPSHILVVPSHSNPSILFKASFFPATVILVVVKIHFAPVLNVIKVNSS